MDIRTYSLQRNSMHSLLHRLHHTSIFQNILSSYSMLASWCGKKKKTSRNTQKDIRQKEASPISLTTSLLSSTKRQGHGNFTDARSSVIALPPQAMQAVFSAQLPSLQCCGYRSEGSPLLRYQSRQTSCLLCMGRVIRWIAFRTCT